MLKSEGYLKAMKDVYSQASLLEHQVLHRDPWGLVHIQDHLAEQGTHRQVPTILQALGGTLRLGSPPLGQVGKLQGLQARTSHLQGVDKAC